MKEIGKKFAKKISAIMKAENLSMPKFAKIVDIPYNRVHDYVTRIKSKPSIDNVGKMIDAFPQYTCYILDIKPSSVRNQTTLKD